MRLRFSLAALVAVGMATVGCGGGLLDPAQNVTETFTGIVPVGSRSVNPFKASQYGEYFVTLVKLTPPLAVPNYPTDVLVAVGGSDSCTAVGTPIVFNFDIIGDNPTAVAGRLALNGVIRAGSYCVVVTDRGFFDTDEAYVVTVSHP